MTPGQLAGLGITQAQWDQLSPSMQTSIEIQSRVSDQANMGSGISNAFLLGEKTNELAHSAAQAVIQGIH
jgi:hypothetical protein